MRGLLLMPCLSQAMKQAREQLKHKRILEERVQQQRVNL